MIIHDLHIFGAPLSPPETDPEPIVDPNAVLTCTGPFQRLETVLGGDPEVIEPGPLFQGP